MCHGRRRRTCTRRIARHLHHARKQSIAVGLFLGSRDALLSPRLRHDRSTPQRDRPGELRVVIDRAFPLAEAADAHAYIESRQASDEYCLFQLLPVASRACAGWPTMSCGIGPAVDRVFFRQSKCSTPSVSGQWSGCAVANHLNVWWTGCSSWPCSAGTPDFSASRRSSRSCRCGILKLAGVIPVHRVIDGATGDQNVGHSPPVTRSCGRGMVALFPEGISHDESTLQPLRTVPPALRWKQDRQRNKGVVTVAVGLTYDAKARFRSRALVRIAEPVNISRWAAFHEAMAGMWCGSSPTTWQRS